MNNWVKTGVSVGFAAAAVIVSLVFSAGASGITVSAGNSASKQVTNMTEFSETLNDVKNLMQGKTNLYDAELLDAEISAEGSGSSVSSFTLVQSCKAGVSYTISDSSNSASASMKVTRSSITAMNQEAMYYAADATLYSLVSSTGTSSENISMQVDMAADVYIPFDNSEQGLYTNAYMKVREFTMLYKGESYRMPSEALNTWIKFEESDGISLNIDLTNAYVLGFDTLVNYVTADAANFTRSGNEYTMNEDMFNALMASVYGAQTLTSLGGTINGSFSVDLSQKTAPEMKLNYNCTYSKSESGASLSASGNEKDSWILKNINNTSIKAEDITNTITIEEANEYWSEIKWPI